VRLDTSAIRVRMTYVRKSLLTFTILCLLATGCVIREMFIRSDPPGARVFIDAEEKKDVTPCAVRFTFYGKREVVIRKKGYLSAKKIVSVPTPWYEYFPLDFVCEILLPFTIRDTHVVDFKLEKIPAKGDTEEILKRARETSSERAGEKKQ
jgi:hypothetical protein